MEDTPADFYNIPPVVVEKLVAMQKEVSRLDIKVASLEKWNESLREGNESLKEQLEGFQILFERVSAQLPEFALKSELHSLGNGAPDTGELVQIQVKQATQEFTREFQNVYNLLNSKPSKRSVQSALEKRSEWFQESFQQLRDNLQHVLKEKADVDAVNNALDQKADMQQVQECIEELQNTIIAAIPPPQEHCDVSDLEIRVQANTAKITQLEAGNLVRMGKNYQELVDQLESLKQLIRQKADYSQLLQVQALVNESGSGVELMRELTKRPTVEEVVEICQGMSGRK